ncbi:MAG: hypothetical protein ABI120_16725 [Gemmatimonadaceae bacterium]
MAFSLANTSEKCKFTHMTSSERHNERKLLRARVFKLGTEPTDDLSAETSAAERLLQVDVLSRRMWELTRKEVPTYSRTEMPVRVVRRS